MSALLILGGMVAVAALIVASMLLSGWALTYLWAWFVVPVFNLPALGLAQAIGIAMVVRYLAYQRVDNKDDGFSAGLVNEGAYALLAPLITLGIGYIVKGYLP